MKSIQELERICQEALEKVTVTQTGCIGVCRLEPMIEVYKEGEEKTTYVEMTAEKAKRIILDHIINGKAVYEYTIGAYEK